MKHLTVAACCMAVGFLLGGFLASNGVLGQGKVVTPAPAPPPRETASFRDVVKNLLPAVVSIETFAKPGKGVPRLGFGSGFFLDDAGTVATNFHVVEGAEIAVIQLLDGRKLTAKTIRTDKRSDLAVLMVDAQGERFAHLSFGDSAAMEIGDRVLAVGAPFGLAGSVTQGIVSSKGRALNINLYEDFLQTDAAINPGNSGGPLVNLDGHVVGIISAIKSKTGGFQGVGLAIASNLAKTTLHALKTKGTVSRGYLGVQSREIDPLVAPRLGVPATGGVLVADVFDKTPAAKAGIRPGDIITHLSDRPIKDSAALQAAVTTAPLSQPLPLDVVRDGKTHRLTLTIEEQPADYGSAPVPAPKANLPRPQSLTLNPLGVDVAELTEQLAEDLGYRKGTQGLVITDVRADSVAAGVMRRGMVITKIDAIATPSFATAREALQSASLKRGLLMQVMTTQGGVNYVLLTSDGK